MDFKISNLSHCFKMCPNRSTMLSPMYCHTEYMKVVCSIHAPLYLYRESLRMNISKSCVRYTMLLLLYLGSLFASTRSICSFCKAGEWLYSRNPMPYRWLSMTIARKRNKYAGDHVCLNISAEDVIMQIDFLIKRLHGSWVSWKQLLKICMKSAGEEDPWKLSNRFMNPYSLS